MDQDQPSHADQQLIRWLRAEMARATGKRYQVQLEFLDTTSLRDLKRLLRDLDREKQMTIRTAQLFRGNKHRAIRRCLSDGASLPVPPT